MRRSAPFGRLFVVVLLLLLQAVPAAAKQRRDTAFMRLYQRYFQLYNEPEHEQEFWKASEQMKAYYRKVGNTDAYYKMRQNEVLYDLDQGRSYHAIKRTNEILEEMKSEGVDYYHIVYASLGTVYESRGNYRMARYYFTQALNDVAPTDSGALISIYSRLASLQSTREPQQAWQWNEKFGQMTVKYPDYHKVYLALKGQICFFMGDKAKFEQVNREFAEYVKGKTFADDYGVACMQIFDKAFGGDYDGALAQLASGDISGLDTLGILDVRGRIYEMMGRYDLSLRASYMRRDLRDSLNSDLMYDNINAVNAEMGLTQLNERTAREREEMIRQTAREREQWLAVVIGLLLTALCLIVWRHLTRRRYQKQLLRQNKALETALDRAQESDRMKMAFIEQVSHEIRTPLNVVTGFSQVIANPEYQLDEQERRQMLDAINRNTQEITNIVGELLDVAEEESHNYPVSADTVNVDQLCREVMAWAETVNNGRLQLSYVNQLAEGYTLLTNRQALTKVLNQLMKNSLKFTQQGSIELKVRERAANGGIEFAVTDTGIGIDAKYSEKIFERFYKVDPFKQGMGLGLTMGRKIATVLGGTLTLDTAWQKGARFLLVLPVGQRQL